MPKPVVFSTRALPKPVMDALKTEFDFRYDPPDRPLEKKEILAGVKQADGIISMLSDPIDQEVFEAGPLLKIVANYAVGYNNIDLKAAQKHRIAVTNTPGVLTETTADLTWALLMAVSRRICEAHQWVQSGQWTGWAPTEMMGADIFGKTLGIIGMGRIGKAVARRAAGFNMKTIYYSRRPLSPAEEQSLGLVFQPLTALLEASDFVTLHLPLNMDSRYLIDAPALHRMKKNAFLINTSRGPVVDEQALCTALLEKEIAGAGLDVFEAEPVISSALLKMNNVVTLPHIGSASKETRVKMGFIVLENLKARFEGKPLPHFVIK